MTLAWHFASTQMRDGRELGAPGEVEEWDGPVVLCKSGLHASERILDALSDAPGALLRRVEISGHQCECGEDKLAGQRRRILWECDMTAALRLFARQCALDVRHLWLWDMPDVVLEYLMTGDERIRTAARYATWPAADAALSAADAAALYRAWDAARDAALYAALYAEWDAIREKQEERLVAYANAARCGLFVRNGND